MADYNKHDLNISLNNINEEDGQNENNQKESFEQSDNNQKDDKINLKINENIFTEPCDKIKKYKDEIDNLKISKKTLAKMIPQIYFVIFLKK